MPETVFLELNRAFAHTSYGFTAMIFIEIITLPICLELLA